MSRHRAGQGPRRGAGGGGAATVPGVVTSASAAESSGTINVNWSPPASDGGSAITGYQVSRDQPAWTSTSLDPALRTYNLTNFTAGVTYSVQVRAVNAIGAGAWTTFSVTIGGSTPSQDYAYTTLSRLFNGTNHYLQVANSTDWSVVAGGALTWSVLISHNVTTFPSDSEYVHFIGKGQGSPGTAEYAGRMYCMTDPNRPGRVSAYCYDPDGNASAAGPDQGAGSYFQPGIVSNSSVRNVPAPAAPVNTWRLISGTMNDGAVSGSLSGRVRQHLNGVKYDEDWMRGQTYTITPRNSTSPFMIGRSGTSHGFFSGHMAYAAVFKAELSETQLAAHYAQLNTGNYVSTVLNDNPVGFWSLQAGAPGLVDLSGNNRPLTQFGTTVSTWSG